MRYDVEADWTLLIGCNYRCSYCFSTPDELSQPIRAVATADQWRAAFDATGLTWLLHITGGEPIAYPQFVELCRTLAERHYLSINTNLSRDAVLAFIGTIDPARVHYFHASFHPEERSKRKGVDPFVARATKLRDAGFNVLVTAVATPELLEHFDEATAPLRQAALVVAPKILRGRYDNRRFPQSYSEGDRRRFGTAAAAARQALRRSPQRLGEAPSIDVSKDDRFLEGIPSFRGRDCDAGYRFVAIAPDGAVRRCGKSAEMGNVLKGTLRLWSEGRACDSSHCFYFCRKYSAPEPRLAGIISALPAWAQRLATATGGTSAV